MCQTQNVDENGFIALNQGRTVVPVERGPRVKLFYILFDDKLIYILSYVIVILSDDKVSFYILTHWINSGNYLL